MARGHRLNTSIVLAAVHGHSGLFRAVSAVEPSLYRPLPTLSPSRISHLAPVDVKQQLMKKRTGASLSPSLYAAVSWRETISRVSTQLLCDGMKPVTFRTLFLSTHAWKYKSRLVCVHTRVRMYRVPVCVRVCSEQRSTERRTARLSSFKRQRAIVSQTNTDLNCFKGNGRENDRTERII